MLSTMFGEIQYMESVTWIFKSIKSYSFRIVQDMKSKCYMKIEIVSLVFPAL